MLQAFPTKKESNLVIFYTAYTLQVLTIEFAAFAMDDICNVVFLRIHGVTKQNGRACEGTLYREPLGEMVVHYDNVYKIEKGPR